MLYHKWGIIAHTEQEMFNFNSLTSVIEVKLLSFLPQQPSSVLIITFCLPPLSLTQITVHCVRKTLLSHYVCVWYICV